MNVRVSERRFRIPHNAMHSSGQAVSNIFTAAFAATCLDSIRCAMRHEPISIEPAHVLIAGAICAVYMPLLSYFCGSCCVDVNKITVHPVNNSLIPADNSGGLLDHQPINSEFLPNGDGEYSVIHDDNVVALVHKMPDGKFKYWKACPGIDIQYVNKQIEANNGGLYPSQLRYMFFRELRDNVTFGSAAAKYGVLFAVFAGIVGATSGMQLVALGFALGGLIVGTVFGVVDIVLTTLLYRLMMHFCSRSEGTASEYVPLMNIQA